MSVTQAKITVTGNSTAVQSHVNTERKAHLQWNDLNISFLCCYYKHESVFDHSEYNSFALFNLLPADEITVYQQTLGGDTSGFLRSSKTELLYIISLTSELKNTEA